MKFRGTATNEEAKMCYSITTDKCLQNVEDVVCDKHYTTSKISYEFPQIPRTNIQTVDQIFTNYKQDE